MDATGPIGHWSRALRHPALRTGLVVGIGLAGVIVAWVLVANRLPALDPFSAERNATALAAGALLMLVPGCRFLRSPGAMFFSCIVAWGMLALAYGALEFVFQRLGQNLGAFHLFVLGGAVLGLVAAANWVAQLLWLARQQPLRATRRRLP